MRPKNSVLTGPNLHIPTPYVRQLENPPLAALAGREKRLTIKAVSPGNASAMDPKATPKLNQRLPVEAVSPGSASDMDPKPTQKLKKRRVSTAHRLTHDSQSRFFHRDTPPKRVPQHRPKTPPSQNRGSSLPCSSGPRRPPASPRLLRRLLRRVRRSAAPNPHGMVASKT